MSKLGDFFNRIKERILPSKTMQLPETVMVSPALKENIRLDNLNRFENPNNYNEYCQHFFSIGDNFQKQYNYLELVSQMQQSGAMADFEKYYNEVQNNEGLYYPSPVHGIDHTSRVTFFAEMLCYLDGISSHDKDLIMRAAQLHDIGREDDKKNFDHGLESRKKIEKYGILSQYPARDQELIKFAVESHSLEPEQIEEKLKTIPRKDRKDFKRILDYLQDADKLDRTRIANKGWGLDPNRLASDTAKRLVKVAHQNFYEFDNIIDYALNKETREAEYDNIVTAFNTIRQLGYNINFEDFKNIVNEYQPRTLEMLMNQGKVEEIFSYHTFKQYSISETPESAQRFHDEIYNDLKSNDQIMYLETAFDADFMLHYNLRFNHEEAYDLYKYVDVDIPAKTISGVASQIKISDLDKFFAKGYFLRSSDLFNLASKLTPEEYRDIIDSGRLEDLFSSKYEKNPSNYEHIQNKLKELGLNYDKATIDQSYRFIEGIITHCPEVLKDSNIANYSFPEIYTAVTKLVDASTRISNITTLSYTEKDVIDLMDYSKHDALIYKVSEKEQLNVVENFVHNKEAVRDPRYVQYMVKKNRPYDTDKIEEILNYNEFCADNILLDQNITLQDAKARLLNGLFNIDVPEKYRESFEKELVEELYYHRKYLPQSEIYQGDNDVAEKITEILSAKNITDFKDLLFEHKHIINMINTHNLGDKIKEDLIDVSRNDIAYNLQKTASEIHSMPETAVQSESGRTVMAKVLSGQQFYLATSTAMPKCSTYSNKILRDKKVDNPRKIIYNQMLQREMDPNEICTSIVSDRMVAHAGSALQDQELKFGFVPESKDAISISAMYDLSSTKKNSINRTTERPVTPRGINDFVNGTTEEHNEAVMSAYPDFIVCYDKITDIAIDKQRAMQEEYNRKGINKKIEIVLVDAKKTYIPQIKNSVLQEHAAIEQKLMTGTLTQDDFELMFEKHESNFVLRTLQAMHSTSYRDDTWDKDYNARVLDSMTRILSKVAEIVPDERARVVLDQVDLLVQRADRNTPYGSRFYDHAYSKDINTASLNETKQKLAMKVYPYERSQMTKQQAEPKRGLTLEEIDTNAINQSKVQSQTRKKDAPDDDGR